MTSFRYLLRDGMIHSLSRLSSPSTGGKVDERVKQKHPHCIYEVGQDELHNYSCI